MNIWKLECVNIWIILNDKLNYLKVYKIWSPLRLEKRQCFEILISDNLLWIVLVTQYPQGFWKKPQLSYWRFLCIIEIIPIQKLVFFFVFFFRRILKKSPTFVYHIIVSYTKVGVFSKYSKKKKKTQTFVSKYYNTNLQKLFFFF